MSTIAVYRTATIPAVADTDSIQFEDGTTAVTGNLDHSALTEGLSGLTIARPWTADIGSATSPLLADVDSGATATLWNNSGGGALFYKPTGDNNLCIRLRHTGFGHTVLTGGTVTTLEVARGRVTIGASCVVTNLYIGGSGKVIHEGNGGTAPTLVVVSGGEYITQRGATTLTMSGGTATFNSGSTAITTINVYGGNINIQRSGTITTFSLYGGNHFNFNIGKSITITNSTLSALVPSASAFRNHSLITFTNAPTWLFADGQNF